MAAVSTQPPTLDSLPKLRLDFKKIPNNYWEAEAARVKKAAQNGLGGGPSQSIVAFKLGPDCGLRFPGSADTDCLLEIQRERIPFVWRAKRKCYEGSKCGIASFNSDAGGAPRMSVIEQPITTKRGTDGKLEKGLLLMGCKNGCIALDNRRTYVWVGHYPPGTTVSVYKKEQPPSTNWTLLGTKQMASYPFSDEAAGSMETDEKAGKP